MRYKVPQNIDMEDRIVGPLTMLQFVYLMVGGMVIYLAYLLFTPVSFWIVAIPVGLFSLAMAFLKVQDQSFPKFLAATMLFLVRPKARVWQKTGEIEGLHLTQAKVETRQTGPAKTLEHEKSASLAATLNTQQPAANTQTVSVPITNPPPQGGA